MSFTDQGPPLPKVGRVPMLCGAVPITSLTKVPTKMVDLTCTNGGFTSKKVGLHLPELENWGFTDLSHRKIGMS